MTPIIEFNETKLSIAIPVYNFGKYLPSTLESIINQPLGREVEILVFDGGSTDDTPIIIKDYLKANPNIRYIRATRRGGIDVDMARCVELVSSPYCWLFSGDDIMQHDAIARVLEALKCWEPDLILGRHNECHLDMSKIIEWPVLGFDEDKLIDMQSPNDRDYYLESSITSEAFFSFMGGLIIKRHTWFKGTVPPSAIGSNWAHVARLWLLMNQPFKVFYMHNVLLDRRGGNDSFSQNGMLARLDIQINGLLDIVENIHGAQSPETHHLRKVLRQEVVPNWANAVKDELRNRNASEIEFKHLSVMLQRILD